jgi:uncharacterized protein YbjQ (UPF0145 family)
MYVLTFTAPETGLENVESEGSLLGADAVVGVLKQLEELLLLKGGRVGAVTR